MVFFGKRSDAVKAKAGAANQNKKVYGRHKKSEVIPADDKWTLDFKKEYLDGLKKQAEESSRILERERAELQERISSHHKSQQGYATPTTGYADPAREQAEAGGGLGPGAARGRAPPKIHVPNPNGEAPEPALDHRGGGVRVYDPSEIPGLGGANKPEGNAARGARGGPRQEHGEGPKKGPKADRQGGRQKKPTPVVVGSGSPGRNGPPEGGEPRRNGRRRDGEESSPGEGAGGQKVHIAPAADPYAPPPPYGGPHQGPVPPTGPGGPVPAFDPYYDGYGGPVPGPYGAYAPPPMPPGPGYAGPAGGPPPPPGGYSPSMAVPPSQPFDPYFGGPVSPSRMPLPPPFPQQPPPPPGYGPPPLPPPGAYGGPPPYGSPAMYFQGNIPGGYPPGPPQPPGGDYFGGYGYQQGGPHGNWQPDPPPPHMPPQPTGEALSPGAHRGHGIASMYGGEDTYERKQKVDARSAYVKELDEQVRLKQEAKEAEKRAAEEYEAKKDAEIEKLAREERVQMQHEQDQHGIPRRRHQQGHPSDSVLGGGGGQFSPPPRPPPNAAPADASPPEDDAARRRHPQGRRVVSELRAGPSEAQQARAAVLREELKLEWERQAAEKKAAAERKKAEEREKEEKEEAEIRAYHAKLQAEREDEERARARPTEAQQELDAPLFEERLRRTPPRHGRRSTSSPTTDMMMEALGEAHSALAEAGVRGGADMGPEEVAVDVFEAGAKPARRRRPEKDGEPRVYSRAEIPGLGGEPSSPGVPPRGQAWPEPDGSSDRGVQWLEPKPPVVVGARATEKRQSRRPRRGWGDANDDPDAARISGGYTAAVGSEVSSLLKELRDEQSALREHVEKHTEAMTALQSQARADRQQAQSELHAVRSRLHLPGSWVDSLDEFVVETHILPKHVNSIPEDLGMLPEMSGHYQGGMGYRAATPELPHTTTRQRIPPHARQSRDRVPSSPAIIRGDLGVITKASGAPGRLGSKLGGPSDYSSANKGRPRKSKSEKPPGRWR